MSAILTLLRCCIGPVIAAFVGGYLFTWGAVALAVTSAVYLGDSFHHAEIVAFLLAFPVFLVVFFWLFVTRFPWRVHGLVYGGGGLMTAAAYALQLHLT